MTVQTPTDQDPIVTCEACKRQHDPASWQALRPICVGFAGTTTSGVETRTHVAMTRLCPCGSQITVKFPLPRRPYAPPTLTPLSADDPLVRATLRDLCTCDAEPGCATLDHDLDCPMFGRTSKRTSGGAVTPGSHADAPRFHALEWVRIRGRGFVAIVECDVERDRNKSGLVGLVVIDEEPFECVGVERHVPAFPIQPGEKIGLLVREVAQ